MAKNTDARNFFAENYSAEVNTFLDKIAAILEEYDVPLQAAVIIAKHTASISTIALEAGMDYAVKRLTNV